MAIFKKGNDATKTGNLIPTSALKVGGEYIFKYHIPPISFAIFSDVTIANWIQQWFEIKKKMRLIDPSSEPLITVTGVSVDTKTGDVWVRARVNKTASTTQIVQAGINPYAVFATIATVFGLIGLTVTLMGVYEVGSTVSGVASSGPIDTIKKLAQNSTFVGIGVGVGVLLTLVLILFLVGRSPNA